MTSIEQQVLNYQQLKQKIDEWDSNEILTNLSLNSRHKTLMTIVTQVHWFDQLRVCEQIIVQKQGILDEFFAENSSKPSYKWTLKGMSIIFSLFKQSTPQKSDRFLPTMIRDTLSDLEVAVEIKEKILLEHPEIKTMDFRDSQTAIAQEAYFAETGYKIGCQLYANKKGLPVEVVDYMYRLPPEFQEGFATSVNKTLAKMGQSAIVELPDTQKLPERNKTV